MIVILTQDSQKGIEKGFYWVLRNEPDQPAPIWEVGQYTGTGWYFTGSDRLYSPTVNPQASNAWRYIETRITMPVIREGRL